MRRLLAVLLLLLLARIAYAQPQTSAETYSTTKFPVNPLDFRADRLGNIDASQAINNSANYTNPVGGVRRNVYLPAGQFYVTHQINMTGQCLNGDGKNTVINVDQHFDPGANGVISLSGKEQSAACAKNVLVNFTQPPDIVTTTTASSAAGTNTITVAQTTSLGGVKFADIAVGNALTDSTSPSSLPTQVTVQSIAGNVLTLTQNVQGSGVGLGDSIHFGPSRTNFKTLAQGCTSGPGGSGCMYPPAIYADGSQTNRVSIDQIWCYGSWDCIALTGTGGGFDIGTVHSGSLHRAITIATQNDFCHVGFLHGWNFGIGGVLFTGAFSDGQNVGLYDDGAASCILDDLALFRSKIVATTNAARLGIGIAHLDGPNANLEVQGISTAIITVNKMYTGNGSTTDPPEVNNPVYMQGPGTLIIGNLIVGGNTVPLLNQTGGELFVLGGNLSLGAGAPAPTNWITISGSGTQTSLRNIAFDGSGSFSPIIADTATGSGSAFDAVGLKFSANLTGTALTLATDSSNNHFDADSNLLANGNLTFTPPGMVGNYNGSTFTPSSSSIMCTVGTWVKDANYFYNCTAPNQLKRGAITTW